MLYDARVKIARIEAAGLRGATPLGGWTVDSGPDDVLHTLVAVHTTDGLVGLGSVYSSETLVRAALEVLAPLCLGESALEPERVAERLHQHTFWLGRGGTLTHAISGIDLALWDILGQVTGQPVGRLLGGRYRTHVRPYASLLMEHPDILTESLLALVAENFRAFKIGWGSFGRQSAQQDEAMIRAARAAIGDDAALMVDAGASDGFWPNGYKWAVRTADMLSSYGVRWFEEPLSPDALEDYTLLRRRSPVPIAGGETLTRRQAFQPWLDARAFDIVQPDVTKVGGLSEQRRIAWSAQDRGVAFVGHGWNTAVGLAADLQLASALPHTELVEYKTGSPYIDQLADGGFALDADGLIAVPDRPGLGVALDLDALDRFTGQSRLLIA
jgi:D-galactarolactone cycloisomerase